MKYRGLVVAGVAVIGLLALGTAFRHRWWNSSESAQALPSPQAFAEGTRAYPVARSSDADHPVVTDGIRESTLEGPRDPIGELEVLEGILSGAHAEDHADHDHVDAQALDAKLDASVRTQEVTVAGQRVTVEFGKKYRFLTSMPANPNPRQLTDAEQRRFAELTDEFNAMVKSGASGEDIIAFSKKLEPYRGASMGGYLARHVWYPLPGQEEPPDSEAVVIDLRTY